MRKIYFIVIICFSKTQNLNFSGMGDRVLCFQCGGGLKDWDPADSPWVEHAKWFGSCPYLAIKKGKDYINYVVHSNKEPVAEPTIATDGPR
jgi:hypothetical protein